MKKYALCGVSGRAIHMFLKPLLETFTSSNELVALLDIDPRRFEVAAEGCPAAADIAQFNENEFDKMVDETKPDTVIVAGRDNTHVDYILAALARDLDVISEKPMVTTAADCARVIAAEKKSKGTVTVTFNMRYPAIQRRLKELILEGKVGRVTSVDLNWYIDTHHGASYFKRWNRIHEYSGGLSIHKSTHHLDMVRWLIDQKPVETFAYGALNYYGPQGEENPSKKDGRHCSTCEEKPQCAYYQRWSSRSQDAAPDDPHLGNLQGDKYTNYSPDACIFDSEIDIEDTYSATIKYDGAALMNYSANFSTPYEGYRLAINGTKGRLETQSYHEHKLTFDVPKQNIEYHPLFGGRELINVVEGQGSHGGSDPLLQEDLFLGPDPQRGYEITAGSEDGALAVALGEAIWRSSKEHRIIRIDEIMK
ncbi:MAG: Gfo/Idh/MocA family oxidoreductase [Planctomycetes bacterium]|nr:Gfo/Idh/MocA family oxidoreductase [Planctomycetota bacterium]